MALFGKTLSRLEDLEQTLRRDPQSRQFLALADELRRSGRGGEALQVLKRGLEFHPGYIAAHVALGRVSLEAGQEDDALVAFLAALRLDRENLVAIRQSAEIYLLRGEKVEAIKKLKLFRALSPGDKDVQETIERLGAELAAPSPEPPPPPITAAPLAAMTAPVLLATVDVDLPGARAEETDLEADAPTLLLRAGSSQPPRPGGDLAARPVPAVAASEPFEPFELTYDGERPRPAAHEVLPLSPAPVEPGPVEARVAADSEAVSADAPVTETLAELYARQGYLPEARAAFEALARQASDPEKAQLFRTRALGLGAAGSERADRLRRWVSRVAPGSGAPVPSLEETLGALVAADGRIRSAALIDLEGLPVVSAGEIAEGGGDEILVAEISSLCKNLRRSRDDVGAGDFTGLAFSGSEGSVVVTSVSEGYALITRSDPGAPRGRVRFLAARAAARLAPDLE